METDKETTPNWEGQMEKMTIVWMGGQRSKGLPLEGDKERLAQGERRGVDIRLVTLILKHTPKPCSYYLCAAWPYVPGIYVPSHFGNALDYDRHVESERGPVAELINKEKVREESVIFL